MVRSRAALPVGQALMAVAIIVTILLAATSAKLAYAATTFTVNSTADPGTGGCDATECTLREAINAANGAPDTDTIDFDVSGTGCASGVCTISPSSELPIITQPVLINGYTQGDGTPGDPSDDARPNTLAVGDNAKLKIKLDGPGAQSELDGLKIETSGSTVKGLIISEWDNAVFLTTVAKANTVQGNFIGTDASSANLGNNIGVVSLGDNNTIGGTTAARRNIISNNGSGVQFNSANGGNQVMGNYIGTDVSGTQPLGNTTGVVIQSSPNNTLGGTTASARNIISGNSTHGILISFTDAARNGVLGNYIGTDVSGTQPLGNGGDGVSIQVDADNNIIGGTAAGAGNVISGNGDDGVAVSYYHDENDPIGSDPDPATSNRIFSNSIYDNDALGIELRFAPNEEAGVTLNDPSPDTDVGPNNLQNFPEITSARLTTRRIGGDRTKVTVIRGTLKSEATKTYKVQFFSSPTADASGYGEGKRFLGQESVETLGSGDASFTFITTKRVPRGQVVAATATNQSTGDTSEFSLAKTVT